jgi:predicted DNA binding CopG/RHH family protein
MLHDVREQEKNLTILAEKKATIEERLIKKQQKIRNEMEFLEKDFNRMKNEFNKYLVSVL